MVQTDFLLADTNSRKLKVTLMVIGQNWSNTSVTFKSHGTLKSAVSQE